MSNTADIQVIKANGAREAFDNDKLLGSLVSAGASVKVAEEIVDHITEELHDGMSTQQIYKHAFFLLHKREKPVAMRYSLRRAIMELGPTGFPFEKFIASIFKEKGYEVLTDQQVLGHCVPHEVDVIAWNDQKLIMAEAKFHNELGLRSDVKTALYVKARMDDLKDTTFNYGHDRKLDEMWLITNTKFTSSAIHYAECTGLKLIGWNYPEKGNLQNLIEDSGLHPVTSITTFSGSQKKSLLDRGIVLCEDLVKDPSIFRSLGLNDEKAKAVLSEIKAL